jgi:hypothetical protein
MAQFPRREADIAVLADRMVRGMSHHTDLFPAPPVAPDDLKNSLAGYAEALHKARAATAAAEQATNEKRDALKRLVAHMKSNLRYAENVTDSNGDKLMLIGWGARRPKTPLQPPGQPANLRILHEGPGWIALDWEAPPEGGKVAAYKVRRSRVGKDQWSNAGVAVETAITLKDQDRGVEWEYLVVAVNRSGQSRESNTVTAVL